MKRWIIGVCGAITAFSLASCAIKSGGALPSSQKASSAQISQLPRTQGSIALPEAAPQSDNITSSMQESAMKNIQVTIGEQVFSATLEENDAATAFAALIKTQPLVMHMRDYSGFEKIGSLENSLPSSNSQITTRSGDIVLYNENQIVVFYGSNSWSYTRLGKIDDLSDWEKALGSGDITVTFSAQE